MSQRDLLALVLSNLNRMRGRVAMTSIGVTIGTAAIILLISMGVGLQTSAIESLRSLGDLTLVTVSSGNPFGVEDPSAPRTREVPLDDEALRDIARLPHVVAVTPHLRFSGGFSLHYGRNEGFGSLRGLSPRAVPALGWKMDTGEARLGRGAIVVGSRVFDAEGGGFGPPGGPPARSKPVAPAALQGRTLTAVLERFEADGKTTTRTERLRVAGVLSPGGGEDDFSIFMDASSVDDLNTWQVGRRRSAREGYGQGLVKVDDRRNVKAVQSALQDKGFQTFSSQDILTAINQLFLMIEGVLGGIGAVALLVAAFGIANTMTMAIYERTREIGIMKALGATNRDVLSIFLLEAGAIGLLGGLAGTTLGWGGGGVIDILVRNLIASRQGPPSPGSEPFHIVVTPSWLVVFAVAFATVIGLASGIYPALRAASMKPLRALRTE